MDNTDYWFFVYGEVLFRLKQLSDLKCPCSFCYSEKLRLAHLIQKMEEAGYITENSKANKFTGKGD